MLYPVEYVDKNKIDYTNMLIEAYNTSQKAIFETGILMAELPFVLKSLENKNMKSYFENEIRILKEPYGEGILNSGGIYPNVKSDNGYKGRGIKYDECGLKLDRIIMGAKCEKQIKAEIMWAYQVFKLCWHEEMTAR